MAWLLFIDESGQDHKHSPYEVLAGVAIHDQNLWKLICELQDAEIAHFGRRYSQGARELKGKHLLKNKTFHHARLNVPVLPNEVPALAKEALDDGKKNGSPRHLKALALAKIGYVTAAFSICATHGCKVFASIVEPDAPLSASGGIRKDYAYLFERYFYFLEDHASESGHAQHGILVFDEIEKSRSHILIDQASQYFSKTATGKLRASLIIPAPFFVHSELTTGIQIADLAAYCVSWGFRKIAQMKTPGRTELAPYADQLARMRHRTYRYRMGKPDFEIWSFAYISDLRTQSELAAPQ